LHFGNKNDDADKIFQPFLGNNIICCGHAWDENLNKDKYVQLESNDLMTRVKQIPKEVVKQHLATIPQFYQHRSTIFTDLGESKEN
jgi:hypothetical protein